MSLAYSRSAVLGLYRALLRNGRRLELTDRDFYFRRIRQEFETKRNIETDSEKLHCLEKGNVFLKNNRLFVLGPSASVASCKLQIAGGYSGGVRPNLTSLFLAAGNIVKVPLT
ncbi:hypothetical protein LSAT2_028593 [Lamellibrachia satsuma]|nr:hypothetical protein LSAT2_028593 [Lamellibrachia satsuma]